MSYLGTKAVVIMGVLAMPMGTAQHALADPSKAMAELVQLKESDVIASRYELESDAADRIRLADHLTMLTQRVAAASCALTSDVAIEESHDDLENAADQIAIILDALRNGNQDLHILGPETNRRLLHDLDALTAEWGETRDAVASVLADGHNVEQAHVIDDHNLTLLELSMRLLSDIEGEYTNPYEITQADAMLLNIAGRQRMLTQKMAKDACEIWTEYHADEGRADLTVTMGMFENSLLALRNGMPAAGIMAAPTPEIEADLEDLLGRWAVLKGNLDALLAGEDLSYDQKYEIFHDFNVELDALEHLVHDYKLYVERHHT